MPIVYLVRHGRTVLNAQGRLRGLADPPLDPIGEQQATALARAVGALPSMYAVVSSPLRRARRTAMVIAETVGVPVSVDDRLTDRDYGPWTGHLRSDVEAEWGCVDAAPGVQPSREVYERALRALNDWSDVIEPETSGGIVVVSHDAVIRPVLAGIAFDVGPVAAVEGTYQVLTRTGGRWSITARPRSRPSCGHVRREFRAVTTSTNVSRGEKLCLDSVLRGEAAVEPPVTTRQSVRAVSTCAGCVDQFCRR